MALFPVRELIPEDFHLDPGQAPPVGPWLQDLAKVGTTLSDCKIGKYFHHGSRRFSEWLFLFCTGGQQRVGFLRRTKCLDLNSDYYYVLKCVTVSSLAGVFFLQVICWFVNLYLHRGCNHQTIFFCSSCADSFCPTQVQGNRFWCLWDMDLE